MFCVRCGNQIYPGQKFCPKCGYPVENHPDPPRKEMDFRKMEPRIRTPLMSERPQGRLRMGMPRRAVLFRRRIMEITAVIMETVTEEALEAATGIATEEALEAATGIAMGKVMFMEWQVREQKPPTGL